MFQTKDVGQIKTHIWCSITFIAKSRVVYEIMGTDAVQPNSIQMTI